MRQKSVDSILKKTAAELRRHGHSCVTMYGFWDCECPDNARFIHPASQSRCPECGAKRTEQPDSRLCEVLERLVPDGMLN